MYDDLYCLRLYAGYDLLMAPGYSIQRKRAVFRHSFRMNLDYLNLVGVRPSLSDYSGR